MRRSVRKGRPRVGPRALVLVGGVVLVLGGGARVLTDRDTETPEPAPTQTPAPGTHQMQVAIDPETGELGLPSPEQAAALQEGLDPSLNRSSEGLQVHHPNGAVSVDLQGRYLNHTVARIGADGKLEYECKNTTHGSEAGCDHVHETDASCREVR